MPKNTSIKKVLVIGSGPIVIGQAASLTTGNTGMSFLKRGRNSCCPC